MQYALNIAIALDRLANAILRGNPSETLSQRLGRAQAAGGAGDVLGQHWVSGPGNYYFRIEGGDNKLHIDIPFVLGDVLISTGAIADTTSFHHVGFTRSGSTGSWTYTFYIDGAASGTTTTSANHILSTTSFYIGTQSGSANPSSSIFDDVRIYSRALTATEVSQLFAFTP